MNKDILCGKCNRRIEYSSDKMKEFIHKINPDFIYCTKCSYGKSRIQTAKVIEVPFGYIHQ